MLDDLKYISKVDKEDALGVAGKQAQQLQHEFEASFTPVDEINSVVLGGMGGSAWPALILGSWPTLSLPFEISRNYTVPSYVGKNTLYIASSFSGNTEEALAALDDAEEKGAQIVVMAAAGKLLEVAQKKGFPLYQIPTGTQPRMSSFYFLAAFVQLFESLGLVEKGSIEKLHEASEWLKSQNTAWLPEVAVKDNLAKQIAENIVGKSAIVYSGPLIFPAANKWKICINENAKNLAWSNQYPELSHNEFIGWSSHPIEKPFAVIELRSNLEHPRVQKRFELTEKLLSGKRPHPYVVEVQGGTALRQVLWSFNLGDYASLYLAILNNVDPTPVGLVEKLKMELG